MELKTKNIVNKSLMKICKELVIVFVIERDPRDAYNVLQLIIKIFQNLIIKYCKYVKVT